MLLLSYASVTCMAPVFLRCVLGATSLSSAWHLRSFGEHLAAFGRVTPERDHCDGVDCCVAPVASSCGDHRVNHIRSRTENRNKTGDIEDELDPVELFLPVNRLPLTKIFEIVTPAISVFFEPLFFRFARTRFLNRTCSYRPVPTRRESRIIVLWLASSPDAITGPRVMSGQCTPSLAARISNRERPQTSSRDRVHCCKPPHALKSIQHRITPAS